MCFFKGGLDLDPAGGFLATGVTHSIEESSLTSVFLRSQAIGWLRGMGGIGAFFKASVIAGADP